MLEKDMGAPAIACLLASGCSLIFQSESDPVAEADKPLYQFKFDQSGDSSVTSTGRSPLVLDIMGSAAIEDGALRLEQLQGSPLGYALSPSPARDANTECMASQAATVAACLTTDSMVDLGGMPLLPARIFAMESRNSNRNNFVLGQGDIVSGGNVAYDTIVGRIGSSEEVVIAAAMLTSDQPIFLAFSISDELSSYDVQIGDTRQSGMMTSTSGNWAWDSNRHLSIGASDTGERPWRGRIHHLEFYCRHLDDDELNDLKDSTPCR